MGSTLVADWGGRWVQRGERLLKVLVALLAAILIFAQLISLTGLVDWQGFGRLVGPPWSRLLNRQIGPRMVQFLAGESVVFLALWAVAKHVIGSQRLRPILGTGTVVAFWRFAGFATLPAGAALYLLLQTDPGTLLFTFHLHGDPTEPIVLTVPSLAVAVVFGATALILAPRPPRSYLGSRLRLVADVAPFVATVGAVLALDRFVFGEPRPWQLMLDNRWFVQVALLAVEVTYLLTAVECLNADRADFPIGWRNSRFCGSLAATRLAARMMLFFGPVLFGFWLALGATLPMASRILDRNGQLLRTYYVYGAGEYRLPASPADISPWMYKAVEAIEDPGAFSSPYTHSPINPVRVAGIFTGLVRSLEGDGELSGGSTIAAQSCKNAADRPLTSFARMLARPLPDHRLLTYPSTIVEKLAFEFPCGWAFERTALWFGGDRRLLTFYLNQTYFGHNTYGVEAAARSYFGKSARDLTLADAAFLAGLPQAPSRLDPWLHPDEARARRREVLAAMVRDGYITTDQMVVVAGEPLGVGREPVQPTDRLDPGFLSFLVQWLDTHGFDHLSSRGLIVTTSIDEDHQSALHADVSSTVERLRQRGINNGGAVILDPASGEVRAWVGGVRVDGEPYFHMDMVHQFPHEPGSAIKPLLYSCALEYGALAPDELLDDTQRVIGGRFVANWDLTSRGRRPAAEELAQSRNTAAAELAQRLTPMGFASCLRDVFQVQTDLRPVENGIDLGLGLADLPMIELAAGYTTLANEGVYHEPTPVRSVRDSAGRVLYRSPTTPGRRALSTKTTTWVTGALRTASEIIGMPGDVATKTGTTPSSSFAAGYGRGIVLAAWVGRTEPGRGKLTVDLDGRDGGGAIWRAQANRRLARR